MFIRAKNWVAKKYNLMFIRTKINVFYMGILFLSLILSYWIYTSWSIKTMEEEISVASMQTLRAIDKNLEFILEDVEQFSNLIFF